MQVDEFNALSPAEASRTVSVWAAIPGWVDAVVAGRPYASVEALAGYARALAEVWSPADLETAVARHPRIGDTVTGADAEATASRSEQASMATAGDDVTGQIAAGNAAYERRFGRVFLIRAAGRSPSEILSELHRRLENDDETEEREATAQLAEIALLRLETTVTNGDDEPEEAE